MPEKKKQHYVPQFYMNLFSNSNKEIAVYNINDKSIHYPVPYKSQCYRDYYYGKDGLWEERLCEMENRWSEVVKAIQEQTNLDHQQIKLIKEFALYQRQRTFAEGEYSKQARIDMIIECGKFIYADKGCPFDEEMKTLCIERASENISPAENLQLAEKFIDNIEDLELLIINYKTKNHLIASDAPVIAINPFHKSTTGYNCMGLILLFPVSTNQMVIIYDSKIYPRFKGKMYVSISNENEINKLNALQLISAEKVLIAKDCNDFSCFSTKDWSARERSKNIGPIRTFGTPKKPLINYTMRKILYNGDFTFAQILNNAKSIPYCCREAFPRQYEQKWEEKLRTKGNIVSQISVHQPHILTDMGITGKEYRKGCKQMFELAKKYWKTN